MPWSTVSSKSPTVSPRSRKSGRPVPEFHELGYRELLVGSYRVQYRIEEKTVWIAIVVHGRRLLTESP